MSSIYRPKPVIYKPNDPFFKEGNIALKAVWLRKQAESDLEVQMIKEEEANLIKFIPIYCESCQIELASAAAYELHYEVMHRNVCSVCQKIFPSAYWLSLHIDEFHNILVQIRKERGEETYKCLVEGCPYLGATPARRKDHLMKQHLYPAYFPFKIIKTGSNNNNTSTSSEATKDINRKEIHRERRRRQRRHKQAQNNDVVMAEGSANEEGDKILEDIKEPVSNDMDIDALTTSMSKLKIPRQVLFGRGNRKPTFQTRQSRG